jgi:glyoxylase-like metal-dependent hydrolase (beta-lactamase superfamily II)
MGLVVREGRALLVDAGLDRDAARRALRACEALDVELEAVFLTHAHADHFGGAYALQERLDVDLYAPPLEGALMEHPIVEPLYLFGGAAPIEELRHKFTLAHACRVTHRVSPGRLVIGPFEVEVVALPGHALEQVGLAVDGVCFCADAFFPLETLRKHKVTFCVDLDQTLDTLARLPVLPYAHFAPGHGPVYAAGEELAHVCAANQERLAELRALVLEALEEPRETAALVARVATHYDLRLRNATAFFLTRAPVLAALTSLESVGQVQPVMQDNRLCWQRVPSAQLERP